MGRLTEAVVGLVLFLTVVRDTEGISCKQPGINSWKKCNGLSTYCCPSISYSRSYYGTTFSSCCPYASKYTNGGIIRHYCTNSYAAELYCTKSTKRCCPSAIKSTNGKYYSGCCIQSSQTQTSNSVCSSDHGSWRQPAVLQICSGENTQCCPHKSYRWSSFGTTFRSCCNSYQYNNPSLNSCDNSNYKEYCSDSNVTCCSSATLRSGKWELGCCSSKTGGRSFGWSVGSIIGCAIGVIVILVVISVIIGVVCRRKRYANRTNTTNMTVTQNPGGYQQQQGYPQQGYPQQQQVPYQPYQGGYPQQQGVQHQPPTGPMGYPVQGGPFVVGSQPGPQVGFQGQHVPMGANQQTAQGAPPPAYHLAAHGPPSAGGPPQEYHTVAQGAFPDNQPT